MGMFKDLHNLKKQAREIGDSYDSSANLSRGMERMRQAQSMMAEQAKAATMAANAKGTGVEATAIIASVTQGTTMINYQPSLDIELTVMRDGAPPYPATVRQVVQQLYLAKAEPGRSVPIKVDPQDPSSIWIDWAQA
jgi:hypothetical protein